MAIGRLQASLAAVTNDLTVAAANINFDFTLIKCEAPKEYQALGKNLSQKRKDDAETGTIHVTARRLGALFEGICPTTPKLVKVYGIRVSEMSEVSKLKSDISQTKNNVFAEHSGVDGSSIWAAATSSTTAIHVQLLACMLARMWSGPEATSIWVELVQERKRAIALQFENGDPVQFSTVVAATQLDIPRSQLADWDASARAWLRTADCIKEREQKQLMSILDKIVTSVNQDLQVLSSVISAWTSALDSMEKLISGMPQAVNSGPTLLALSAWHLYPDILVLGRETAEIRFKDNLIAPGGVLTVGLAKPGDDAHHGVYWSLSLAHLRYYGRPILAKRHISRDSSRLSFRQFCQAAFGCLLGSWDIAEANLHLVAEFFVASENTFEYDLEKHMAIEGHNGPHKAVSLYFQNPSHWFHLIADAARACIDQGDEEQTTACKLVRKGMRQSAQFLATKIVDRPFFRLSASEVLFPCLDGPEARVEYLRYFAKTHCKAGANLIIQYRETMQDGQKETVAIQYATAFQPRLRSSKRNYLGQIGNPILRHTRWLMNQGPLGQPERHSRDTNEEYLWSQPDYFLVQADRSIDVRTASGVWQRYVFRYGDPSCAAIFEAHVSGTSGLGEVWTGFHSGMEVATEDLLWCLKSRLVSSHLLLRSIEKGMDPKGEASQALKAISTISMIYKLLPDATIAIGALERPLHLAQWARAMYYQSSCLRIDNEYRSDQRTFDENLLDRNIAFSCVAYLESGYVDIAPVQLVDVIALSSGDSMYVAMPLLCDPYEVPQRYELKRILGNVGRAGITMMVPPQNPIFREPALDSWQLISTANFDGQAEDFFSQTTLHLSFTDYNTPIYDGLRGGKDSQVFFLESVVSIHDRGVWVGDIDILAALSSPKLQRLPKTSCNHKTSLRPDHEMISVESWDEILNLPEETLVVRASGNSVARLAIAAILIQCREKSGETPNCPVRYSITICPSTVCWKHESQGRDGNGLHFASHLRSDRHVYIY